MRFDDRLLTVLERDTPEPHDRAVQWRQIVELLARGGDGLDPAVRRRALTRLAEVSPEVPVSVRAAAARGIAGPTVPAPLVALFAADTADVAAPLLTAASISEDDWSTVRSVASPGVRVLLAALRPETTGLFDLDGEDEPPVETPVVPTAEIPAASPVVETPPVERREPPPLEPGMFRWECGPSGTIDWVDGVPRAAVIGGTIADALDRRFEARLPFNDEPLVAIADGALAGDWRWSGTPAFLPGSGRFAGYRGVARREGTGEVSAATSQTPARAALDGDSLRELVHELRTPLNAIIGFGEIIDGQYLGPAQRAYRDRAGEIVRQGRLLLSAVEDLDFAAKLQSGRVAGDTAAEASEIVATLRQTLGEQAARRGISLSVANRAVTGCFALDRALAERLIGRFAAAVIDAASSGERLDLIVERTSTRFRIAIARPNATRGLSDEALFDPDLSPGAGGGPSIGFALRLVRGLAGLAGGALEVTRDTFVLALPAQGR